MTAKTERTEEQADQYLRILQSEQKKALEMDKAIQRLNSQCMIREQSHSSVFQSRKLCVEVLEREIYRLQVQLGELETDNKDLRSQVNCMRKEVLGEKRHVQELRSEVALVHVQHESVKRTRAASGNVQVINLEQFDTSYRRESQDLLTERREISRKMQALISPRKVYLVQTPIHHISENVKISRLDLMKSLVRKWNEMIRTQRVELKTYQTHIKCLKSAFERVQNSSPSETAQKISAWFREEAALRKYLLSLQDETNSLKSELQQTRNTMTNSALLYSSADSPSCDFLSRFKDLQFQRPLPQLKSFLKSSGFTSSKPLIPAVSALTELVQEHVKDMRKMGQLHAIQTSRLLDVLSVLFHPFQELRTLLMTLGLKSGWGNGDTNFSLETTLEQIFDLEEMLDKLVKFLIYKRRIAPMDLTSLQKKEKRAVSVPVFQIEARADDLYPLSPAELRKRATLHFDKIRIC